jgi:hypothetical protein
VVRCRGTRFVGDGHIAVTTDADAIAGVRVFQAEVGLQRRADRATPEESLVLLPPAAPKLVSVFNTAAQPFARIVRQRLRLQAGPFVGKPADPAAVPAWLRTMADLVAAHAAGLKTGAAPEFAPAVEALDAVAAGMRQEADDLAAGPGQPGASPERVRLAELEMAALNLDPIASNATFALTAEVQALVLAISDLPTDKEAGDALQSGLPAAAAGGRLWQLCRERLLGAGSSLHIRATDTRNAIAANGQQWIAPGVVEAKVGLPAWFGW